MKGKRSRRIAGVFFGAAMVIVGAATAREEFPAYSIEIVVTFGPGGAADAMAKALAPLLEKQLRTPFQVSNVAGGSGNAGLTKLLTNPPDGYTIATLTALTVASWTSGVGYARPQDFSVLGIVEETPSMLFVSAGSPFRSFRDLLEHAKSKPGGLRVATAGQGTIDDVVLRHLAALGYRMNNVPFAKPEERHAALEGKRVDMVYEEPGVVMDYMRSDRWRPLVVFADYRHFAFMGVPTAAEFGIPISDLSDFRALVVRAGTAPERVKLLADAIRKVMNSREWRQHCQARFTCAGMNTPAEAMLRVQRFNTTVQKYLPADKSSPASAAEK